jgi:hypothetical protein
MTVEELTAKYPRRRFGSVEVYRAWAYMHFRRSQSQEPVQVVDKGWLIQLDDHGFPLDVAKAVIADLQKAISYCEENP